jgi:hypothetical protein
MPIVSSSPAPKRCGVLRPMWVSEAMLPPDPGLGKGRLWHMPQEVVDAAAARTGRYLNPPSSTPHSWKKYERPRW